MSTCTVCSDLDLHLADIRRFVSIRSTSMFTDLYQHLVDIRTSVSLKSTCMFIDLYRHLADICVSVSVMSTYIVCSYLYQHLLIKCTSVMSTYLFRDLYQHLADIRRSLFIMSTCMFRSVSAPGWYIPTMSPEQVAVSAHPNSTRTISSSGMDKNHFIKLHSNAKCCLVLYCIELHKLLLTTLQHKLIIDNKKNYKDVGPC